MLAGPEYENPWMTFIKQFVALFPEDCHDGAGWLYHICHGEHGMDKANNYFASINFNIFPHDLVAIKLEQLKTEFEHLL